MSKASLSQISPSGSVSVVHPRKGRLDNLQVQHSLGSGQVPDASWIPN